MAEIQVSSKPMLLRIEHLTARVLKPNARAVERTGQIAISLIVPMGAVVHTVTHVVRVKTSKTTPSTSIITRTRCFCEIVIILVLKKRKGAVFKMSQHEVAWNAQTFGTSEMSFGAMFFVCKLQGSRSKTVQRENSHCCLGDDFGKSFTHKLVVEITFIDIIATRR